MQVELVKSTGLRDRGIKSRTDLAVLRRTKMPAILCECGFMDNLEEAKLMLDENYQWKVAESIGKGICNYLGVKYVPKPAPAPTGTLYKVQVGAFREKANADKLANELKRKGYNTYIVKEG